jgi:hypothetical protein
MSYRLLPGKIYRMPTHFGPAPGPRQGDGTSELYSTERPHTTTISVTMGAKAAQLAELLPEGFEVATDPTITIAAGYSTDIPWLAGRGYNTLGVTFPAFYKGREDRVHGDFLAVLWENMADPIISGRDELGFSKVYCELPEPVTTGDETYCTASWMGFTFMELRVKGLGSADHPFTPPSSGSSSQGLLHYKYVPRTGEWGEADAAYAVLTPVSDPFRRVTEFLPADEGAVTFFKARWEELPTLCHIVNALHGLELSRLVGACIVKTRGAKDLRDQRILR